MLFQDAPVPTPPTTTATTVAPAPLPTPPADGGSSATLWGTLITVVTLASAALVVWLKKKAAAGTAPKS